MKKLLIFFGAGCLGALANSLTVWALGNYGITKALEVSITPALSPGWLYPRIVWGEFGDYYLSCLFSIHNFFGKVRS
jgi:hypothetical protein